MQNDQNNGLLKEVLWCKNLSDLEEKVLSDYSNGLYSKDYQGLAQIVSIRRVGTTYIDDSFGDWIEKEGLRKGDGLPTYEVEILLT